ncbi:alpha/beta hydrolase [Pseudomonas oryzihabitans]|uniref:alpha/beta hydrolase n=1 Tax=Pseudomonas oryzihabitans TaxID=47885 RepID=UPI0005AA71CB|nr:alpha/beta hydrolase [Pseudomonas oryzihabitans]NMZ44235.1 alpha/beta hydrolase [Pseudomonas oryzihabitans]
MAFAEGIEEFIDRCNRVMPPNSYQLPIAMQRKLYSDLLSEFPYKIPAEISWEDISKSQNGRAVKFRIYRPVGGTPLGLVFYIRGGGYVMGSLDSHHSVAAEMALYSNATVIAADFRLAPEHPFPAALEDCYNILTYIEGASAELNLDLSRVVVAGDSSGGNMAVVLAMMCRDRRGPKITGQALISPVLDFTRWRKGGEDVPLLTGGEMEFYTACYSPDIHAVSSPHVSPLVSGNFSELPEAYIMGAEMDSLVIDAVEYARLLRENGIDAELVIEPGLVHAAVRARSLSPAVQNAWIRFCYKIRRMVNADV